MRRLWREVVPAGHCPAALVGQWGVRCSRGYAAGTVLGEYEGRYALSGTREASHNDYALGGTTLDARKLGFSIDPLSGGNRVLEYMNDYRVDVRRPTDRTINNPELANARWVTVQRGSEPHMIVMATRALRPGDWVCIDYSDSYWSSRAHSPLRT